MTQTEPKLRPKISLKKREPYNSRENRLSGLKELNPDLNWSDIEKMQKETLEKANTPSSGRNWREEHERLLSKIESEKEKCKVERK